MERGLMMLLHAIIIGLILYLIMLFGLKQPKAVAENRSLLIAAIVLIYMLLFGHGLPKLPMNI
jgi:CBS domain containing-hemolysin-like protein